MNVIGIIAGASNVRGGENPPYTADDFRTIYPQFFDEEDRPLVPQAVLDLYLQFAHGCVLESRYGDAWKMCISLFVAHFLTLYMQSMVHAPGKADAKKVMDAGQVRGLVTSKSVGGVSASYDYAIAMQDLDGWAAWKLTSYGVQFATQAKILTMGGMYIP